MGFAVLKSRIQRHVADTAAHADTSTFATISTLDNYATRATLNNYATLSTLDNYATRATLNNYATLTTLNNYLTVGTMANYKQRRTYSVFYDDTIVAEITATGAVIYMDDTFVVDRVHIAVPSGGLPTAGTIIVDVNKAGTTIFTDQYNRPSIVTNVIGLSGIPNITQYVSGDSLTVDIDTANGSFAGKDLLIQIRGKGPLPV